DLLDVSRINSGKIELRKEPTELGSVIDHGLATSRPLVGERGHHLHLDVPSRPVQVTVDATRLAQVVSNLLNNAAKYTPAGGNTWLAVEVDSEDVTIRVRDDGMGIEPEEMSRVFELFVQTHASVRQAPQGGLGIGLTLVKRLVELHGGEVRGFSEGPGHGTEFVITLPDIVVGAAPEPELAIGSLVGDERSGTLSSPPVLSPLRILVVEDN